MVFPLLLSSAVSFGGSFLLSLFGPGKPAPRLVEVGKQEDFTNPVSKYGQPIPDVYGRIRVGGNYIGARIPPNYETDEYKNGETNEIIQTSIYFGDLAVLWCRNPTYSASPEIHQIWFDGKPFYAGGNIDGLLGTYWGKYEGVTINQLLGGQTTVDPIIQDFMGVNAIVHKGKMLSTMKRLRLSSIFDNRYPALSAEIFTHTSGDCTLGGIISDIMAKAGYDPSEYDTTELDAVPVLGFIAYNQSARDKLAQLQQAFFFEAVDTGSKIKFITQARPSASALFPLSALAGQEGEPKAPEFLFTVDQVPETELPSQIVVKYYDYNRDYRAGAARSVVLGTHQNIVTVDLALTLTESAALEIANKLLLLAWIRRRTYKFTVLPKYNFLEAGDVVQGEFWGGETVNLQIKRITHQASGLIDIEAYPYDSLVYGFSYTAPAGYLETVTATQGTPITLPTAPEIISSVTSADGTTVYVEGVDYTVNYGAGTITPTPGGGITNGSEIAINYQAPGAPSTPALDPYPVNLAILDIVKPTDNDGAGLYAFANTLPDPLKWQGATLYLSRDTGASYSSLGQMSLSSFGPCLTTLGPDAPGASVQITVPSTVTLSSASAAQLAAGANLALVGAEILQFGTVTLDAQDTISKTYTLSDPVRGLRGTSAEVGAHGAGESFYLLSGYKKLVLLTTADVGQTFYFKAVSPGQELADVAPVVVIVEGNCFIVLEPRIDAFSPTHGAEGTAISIYGAGFTGATGASINGTALDSFVVVSDTLITGTVGVGTTTGKVEVGTAESVADFVIAPSAEWGLITGDLPNQTDLIEILDRSWKYTTILTDLAVPTVGGTVDVTVEDARYYIPGNFPIIISTGSTIAQFNLIAKTGNVLTLERLAYHTSNASFFAAGAYLYPGIEVNQIVNIVSDLGLPDLDSRITDLEDEIVLKEPTITAGTTSQYWRGDKKFQTLDKAAVGLGNVNNTSDADKPISTATQAALDTKLSAVPFGGLIETIANKTYPLFTPDRSYKIKSLRVKSESGTCTWAIQIAGVNVTGLSSISVSSIESLTMATGLNTVASGQRVTIVSTANASALNVEFTIMLETV